VVDGVAGFEVGAHPPDASRHFFADAPNGDGNPPANGLAEDKKIGSQPYLPV